MTTTLPTLELKYNKETTSKSSKTNTINNNIIIEPSSEIEVPDIELPEPTTLSVKNLIHLQILANLKKLSSLY